MSSALAISRSSWHWSQSSSETKRQPSSALSRPPIDGHPVTCHTAIFSHTALPLALFVHLIHPTKQNIHTVSVHSPPSTLALSTVVWAVEACRRRGQARTRAGVELGRRLEGKEYMKTARLCASEGLQISVTPFFPDLRLPILLIHPSLPTFSPLSLLPLPFRSSPRHRGPVLLVDSLSSLPYLLPCLVLTSLFMVPSPNDAR